MQANTTPHYLLTCALERSLDSQVLHALNSITVTDTRVTVDIEEETKVSHYANHYVVVNGITVDNVDESFIPASLSADFKVDNDGKLVTMELSLAFIRDEDFCDEYPEKAPLATDQNYSMIYPLGFTDESLSDDDECNGHLSTMSQAINHFLCTYDKIFSAV